MEYKVKKSKAKTTIFVVVVIGMLLVLGVGCSNSDVSTNLEGEWEITKAEEISNDIYSTGYSIIFSEGDKIKFVDNKTVNMGAFPFEYEVAEDNVIKLVREGTTSIVFDFEIVDEDTLVFENENFKIESIKID